jgi:hypothetical protein
MKIFKAKILLIPAVFIFVLLFFNPQITRAANCVCYTLSGSSESKQCADCSSEDCRGIRYTECSDQPAAASQTYTCWCTTEIGNNEGKAPEIQAFQCNSTCSDAPCVAYINCSRQKPPASSDAQTSPNLQADPNKYKPKLQVAIGGRIVTLSEAGCTGTECTVGWIGEYIAILYKYGVAVAAVLAVLMIMVGGLVWLMSGGSPDKVGKGKEFITSALTGLMLALFSFMILYTVNPKLVNLSPITYQRPQDPIFDFGVGVTAEAKGGDGAGGAGNYEPGQVVSGRTDMTGLSQTAIDGINTYASHGCDKSSGWRQDGSGSRHQSGRSVDFSLTADCSKYIRENGQLVATGNKETWYNQVYKMPDGSYWVDENISVTQGSGAHWHTEFPDDGWVWQLNK